MYGLLALLFSIIGLFLDTSITQMPSDPFSSVSVDHVLGHVIWGMVVAIPTLGIRYIVASGLFAIILDFDHIIQFFGFDMISRMGHSIPFAVLSVVSMMIIFGRRDYLLGAISFAAVLSHISFDTFLNSGKFPMFIPFNSNLVLFQQNEWMLILLSAITVVFSIKIIVVRKDQLEKKLFSIKFKKKE